MNLRSFLSFTCAAEVCMALATQNAPAASTLQQRDGPIAPKVFIFTMFPPEAEFWLRPADPTGAIDSLLAQNVTVPGFAPLYPHARCQASGEVCLLITGEGEINAAATVSALTLSTQFDLRQTYFLIAGIAGVNPNEGTLADVAFAKYAVQIGLQYEFDAREMPAGWNTGYSPLGSDHPENYPTATYGTEVFELNTNLRDIAMGFTSGVKLNDSADSVAYRAHYNLNTAAKKSDKFKEAIKKPSVRKGDVVTSDQYFSGTLLGESFVNTTRLFTNGSGTYCMTAQEDNATLEALLRGAARKVLDFSRIIVMRAAADFDRPYPGLPSYDNLFVVAQGAFNPSLLNLYIAGTPVVKGILKEWTTRFQAGIKPSNYVGDIFGTLGGKPDFGPYRVGDNPVQERELPAKTVAGNPRGKGKSGYHVTLKAQGLE